MAYLFLAIAIVLRVVPHPWNFTPVGAMFLFSGATLPRKSISLALPLLALIASDAVAVQVLYGGSQPLVTWSSPFTWLGFVVMGALGWSLRRRLSPMRLLGVTVTGSLLFFVISNFGVWIEGALYARTLDGLVQCYAAAIPFFRNTLCGDLVYTAVLFGSYRLFAKEPRATAASP